jgi:hypothetical protein
MRVHLPRWAIVTACATVAGLVAAACTTDYQKGLEDPLYGDPNALAGKKQPGPTIEVTREGGAGSTVPLCVARGGTLVADGGACTVSFKTNILGAFKQAACNAAGSCHGAGANPPDINPDDPGATYIVFSNYVISNPGTLYINPCSTDPVQSAMYCNCNLAAPCGTRAMPPAAGLPANLLADIDTWLKCGSPNN